MNNDCLIVYESIYNGNTEKIAKTMSQTLGCHLMKAKDALTKDLSQYRVIGFGSGIYFGTHHPAVMEVVRNLTNSDQEVFIFSSRGAPVLGKYHEPLKLLLTGKGKKIVGEFSVRGYDETGPWVIIGGGNVGKPDEKDLKKAAAFLRRTLGEYCITDFYNNIETKRPVTEGYVNTYSLEEEGIGIVLKGDFVTINQNACQGCGRCIKVCPMRVIELANGKAIPQNEMDCTLCRLCEKECGERAITLHYSWLDAIHVARRHGKRKTL